MVKITCISDIHNHFPANLPGGDILIVSGDVSMRGTFREISAFNAWVERQPYDARVLIAGNHDWLFETSHAYARSLIPGVTHYLQDSGAEICGLSFWGMPYVPQFMDWAFMCERGAAMQWHTNKIPDGIDVLVTHGPPMGIMDKTATEHVGCEDLLAAIQRVKPKLHVFGHIHDGHGTKRIGETEYVNASIMDDVYRPTHLPIQIGIENGQVTYDGIVQLVGAC